MSRAATNRRVKDSMMRQTRIAIYVRISNDREGKALGVKRQTEDLEKAAADAGVIVVKVYSDNDIGASTRSTKPRPEYEQMLRDARAGRFDEIWSYTSSRLTRRPLENEALIALAEQCGIGYAYLRSPKYDLNTADGRKRARDAANDDAHESERISERVTRARKQQAEQGRYGGGRRRYGFCSGPPRPVKDDLGYVIEETLDRPCPIHNSRTCRAGVTPVKHEWEVIRDRMGTPLLEGVSLREITRNLNAAGIPATSGGKWTSDTVRGVLLRPSNAGRTVYAATARTDDGRRRKTERRDRRSEMVGKMRLEDAIFTEAEYDAIVSKLTSPTRRTNKGNEVRWLLSGIATCVCGGPMRVSQSGNRRACPRYVCTERRPLPEGVKTHVARAARELDSHVTDVVLEWIANPQSRERLTPAETPGVDRGALNARRKRLEGKLDDLSDAYSDPDNDMSASEYARDRRKVKSQIDDIDAQLAEALDVSAARVLVGVEDIRAAWEALTLAERRAIVRELVTVEVLPAGRGAGFRPESVRVAPVPA